MCLARNEGVAVVDTAPQLDFTIQWGHTVWNTTKTYLIFWELMNMEYKVPL